MVLSVQQTQPKYSPFTYPVLIAKKFIHLFQRVKTPNDEQQAILAAAYYTLAIQHNISNTRSNMHINAAITLLKNIPPHLRKLDWASQISHAYFKRAELLEDKNAFIAALYDYQQAIVELESQKRSGFLTDKDCLILAQSAISIADLIVSDQLNGDEIDLFHPLFYVNQALEGLAEITETDDEIWATHSYAHRVAGLALSEDHREEAKEAFRVALLMAFKTDSSKVCPLLADIYSCIGLIYEQTYSQSQIKKDSIRFLEHAKIYFDLSILFSPSEGEELEDPDSIMTLEPVFEMIYRVLDPYLSSLSYQPVSDLIDALIFAFMCAIDKVLPNQILAYQLSHPEILDTFAQHIHWLLLEANRRKNLDSKNVELYEYNKRDVMLDMDEILDFIQNQKTNNVHYLESDELTTA